MFRKTLLLGLSILMGLSASASVYDLPVQQIKGRNCYVYRVLPKEGELAICHKLEITREQLLKYNPEVSKGLKADQQLYFPVDDFKQPREVYQYKARKGDTLYGLSKMFKMTQDEFMILNPEAEAGVKEGNIYKVMMTPAEAKVKSADTNLSAAVSSVVNQAPVNSNTSAPVAVNEVKGLKKYVIADHESLYQIAHNHGITLENLLALNPGLQASHYEAGAEILVPDTDASSADSKVSSAFEQNNNQYTVKAGDTFYGISRAYGISIEQLQNANPGLNILQEGTVINIPQACAEEQQPAIMIGSGEIPVIHEGGSMNNSRSRLTVAVALPFMASQKEPSKQARQYAEFYRGFMLGVDSMRRCGNPISILAFDTQDTDEGMAEILENPVLADAQVIIGPDNTSHLAMFADYGASRGIKVLNLFSVKDTLFESKPELMQANIPHDAMFERAIAYEAAMAPEFTPVILRKKGAVDKKEYVSGLMTALAAKGVTPIEINYDEQLTDDALKKLPVSGRYMFIPVVSRQADINKFLPALVDFKGALTSMDAVRLLGYPEWITYRGKTLENMQELEMYIYSRFLVSDNDPAAKDLDSKYKYWYGSNMMSGLPRQGLLGFDVALYLIRSLSVNQGDFDKYSIVYDGVQNPFHFRRAGNENSGWVNDELYMINLRPSGLVEKIVL